MIVAVIPARGGSKRIPLKNVKSFAGKPMISWSIAAAQESGCFDQIIVSTDDPDIADVAISSGATVPFLRPSDLADDMTGTQPVVIHAIEWLQNEGVELTEVCCLYATAPFVEGQDLRSGLELLRSENARYSMSVTSFPYPIQRALAISSNNRVSMLQPGSFQKRSQDLEEAFHDAGQFYWGTAEAWLSGEPAFLSDTVPVVLPRHRVQDIDTPEDWERAEWIFKAMLLANGKG